MNLNAEECDKAISHLTAVRVGLQLMRRQHPASPPMSRILDATDAAADQLSDLLLSCSHATSTQPLTKSTLSPQRLPVPYAASRQAPLSLRVMRALGRAAAHGVLVGCSTARRFIRRPTFRPVMPSPQGAS